MSVVEFIDGLSLETQISVGGLIVLVFILTALHLHTRRALREQDALRAEREMAARIDALMRKLEGKNGRNGRDNPSVARFRPLKRTAEKRVPAARCPSVAKAAPRRA